MKSKAKKKLKETQTLSPQNIYIKLQENSIFKLRYGQWYLINVKNKENERLLIDEDTAVLLRFLFQGKSINEAQHLFDFDHNELGDFIRFLTKEQVIRVINNPIDSSSYCYDIEPPVDSLNVLITNACNLQCRHCYINAGRKLQGELNGAQWIALLEEAKKLGVFQINISGGEPLCHPDFPEIIQYLSPVTTFNANLNTNGTLMKRGEEQILAKAFSSIQISLDSASAGYHDSFRGSLGSFNKSVETIKRLVAYGIETNVGFSLTPDNIDQLENLVILCEKLGVKKLSIGLVVNIGRACDNQIVTHEKHFLDRVYKVLVNIAGKQTKLEIMLPFRFNTVDEIKEIAKCFICRGDDTQIVYITADGTVVPCDKLPVSQFAWGNIEETSLKEIWLSPRMQSFKLMRVKDLSECGHCPHLRICGGACVARAFHSGGTLQSKDSIACTLVQLFLGENKLPYGTKINSPSLI